VWQTIGLGWLQTLILLISASWVARITGVSHQCQAPQGFLIGSLDHAHNSWRLWIEFFCYAFECNISLILSSIPNTLSSFWYCLVIMLSTYFLFYLLRFFTSMICLVIYHKFSFLT
jgi:hypothetical protein